MKAAADEAHRIADTMRALTYTDQRFLIGALRNRGFRTSTTPGIRDHKRMVALELKGLILFDPLRTRAFPRETQDYRLSEFGRSVAEALVLSGAAP